MCGIVGAVSARNIVPILVEGLRRLEYRGYDSCGVAVHQGGGLRRARSTSRVAELAANVAADGVEGGTGIAHTRWATHGAPVVHNAHPHFSHGPGGGRRQRRGVGDSAAAGRIGLVHNGIIENHDELRAELQAKGYAFVTQTDTEVIAHLVDHLYDGDLLEAVQRAAAAPARRLCDRRVLPRRAAPRRRRAPGLAAGPRRRHRRRRERELPRLRRDGARRRHRPDRLPRGGRRRRPAARQALDQPRRRQGRLPPRRARRCAPCVAHTGAAELGPYRHYMQKEIFEQPQGDRRHARRASPASRPSCSATARTASSRRSTRC